MQNGNSWVFLLRQLWILNYYAKSSSNNLSSENINTGFSVVFKTKCELKCQNELFLKYHFSGNTSLHWSIRWINWNQKLKLKTITQIFLLITFQLDIHLKKKTFFLLLFSCTPFQSVWKSCQIFIYTTKNILDFSI